MANKFIGKDFLPPDVVAKVTGKARYSADISLPGLLYGKVLRSPHAHAIIKSIDLSKALALPGVREAMVEALESAWGNPASMAHSARFISLTDLPK